MFWVGCRIFIATKSAKTSHLCHSFSAFCHSRRSANAIRFYCVVYRCNFSFNKCYMVSQRFTPIASIPSFRERILIYKFTIQFIRLGSIQWNEKSNRNRSHGIPSAVGVALVLDVSFEISSVGQVEDRWATGNAPNSLTSHCLPSLRCHVNV